MPDTAKVPSSSCSTLAGPAVRFVVEIADQFLDHVLETDDADDGAVFVDDERDVLTIGAHLEEEVLEAVVLRRHHDRPGDGADLGRRPRAVGEPQEVLDVDEPADMVEIAFVDHDSAPAGALCLGGGHLDGCVGRHCDDVAASGHGVGRRAARQFE